MARQNVCFLLARVRKAPSFQQNDGIAEVGLCYVDVVRSLRNVDDKIKFVKHDYPLIVTREKEIIDSMQTWQENSIVFIKGTLNTKKTKKISYCGDCTDENGNATENITEGNLVYITPIYVRKERDCETKQEAVEYIVNHREVSNQIYILGTLLKDPKIFTTKQGVQITQYPIAINRKFTIRADDPSIRTDYPVVKSYGEQAREDKTYLKYQADVIIDGFIQARTLTRKCKCKNCGKIYEWKDHAMELVPYDVEYVSGFKTKEEAEAEYQHSVEEYKQILFNSGYKDELEDELITEDIKQ